MIEIKNMAKRTTSSSTWDLLKPINTVNESSDENTKIRFESSKFIVFQSTIVASVKLDSNSYFLIDPKASKFINSNGEGWSNESLYNNYKSFIGAFACLDHPDYPEQDNVGVILDAILRKRWINKDQGTFVYYVDILVAIDKQAKQGQLARLILNGSIQYMSMGCNVAISYCSRCGQSVDYETNSSNQYNNLDMCSHLMYSKGKRYIDNSGKERIVAELLGKEANSVEFIEASVLSIKPAFSGAILSRILPITTSAKYIELSMPTKYTNKGAVKKYLLPKSI